jgi:hypothetical protein
MIEKTKVHPGQQRSTMTAYFANGKVSATGVAYIDGGTDVIRYEDKPMYTNGHLNWKSCLHDTSYSAFGSTGYAITVNPEDPWTNRVVIDGIVPSSNVYVPALPSQAKFDPQVIRDVLDQVNLNCRDTVLYYSGVLQAIPLVGGVLRFNRIMKDLAKQLKRDFLRKPFRTVIKSAISLDFIDRFVVKPTIDDARKFNDAVDYIFRVYQTAHERSAAPFALQAKRNRTFEQRTSSGSKSYIGWNGVTFDSSTLVEEESKAFLYLSAKYDTAAINPIHLWATRAGITRPLESVWDLVPFSFVVDYFTRAGDWIQEVGEKYDEQEALLGKISTIHAFWGSHRVTSSVKLTGTGAYGDRRYGGYVEAYAPGTQTFKREHFARFPIGDPLAYLAQLEEDTFLRVNLSPTRKRTLAQLFVQAKL